MGGHEIRPNHMKVKATRFRQDAECEVRILPPQPTESVSVGVEKAKPIVVTQMVDHTDLFERA